MATATDRQERISWWNQDILRNAHIAVIGAGALGNEVLKNLALLGIGRISLFDFDLIEESNLSRTLFYGRTDIGASKAVLAASRTKSLSINPECRVDGFHGDVVWDLGDGYLRRVDLIFGCLDNLEARLAMGTVSHRYGIPFIDGGIRELGGRVQIHNSAADATACMDCTISEGQRLALSERYSCHRVLKSEMNHEVIPTVQTTSAIIAAIMCQEGVKFLHGKPTLFGHVIRWSGDRIECDVLKLQKDPACLTCAANPIFDVISLPLSHHATLGDFLSSVSPSFTFSLPSRYIRAVTCSECDTRWPLGRPAHRCTDQDLICPSCGSSVVALDALEVISNLDNATLTGQTLEHLGFPAHAIVCGGTIDTALAYELSKDLI